MQNAGGCRNHQMEMATADGRARNPPSRADLPIPLDARRANATVVRIDQRRSPPPGGFRIIRRYSSAGQLSSFPPKSCTAARFNFDRKLNLSLARVM